MLGKLLPNIRFKFRWHLFIIIISLLAIILSILSQLRSILSPNLPLWIAIIIGGIPAILQILLKLFRGDLGSDSLAAIALVTAIILNQYLAAVIIILMIESGQGLEAYAMRRASLALLALTERMPKMIHRKKAANIEDIPIDSFHIGDIIVVYPHETCPVDGTVMTGHGSMDESYLTGEPYQISKAPGASVLSGSINGESMLTVRAQKLASESHYASIVAVLQEAEQKRPTIRRLGDQIGAIFAPLTLIFAFATWYFTGEAIRFLAVLVIATPCPLLIAIPITIISAISLAAKRSIIIKDPTILERLPTCRTAIFDKTGTLTYGKPLLTEILVTEGFDSDFVLQNVASLERYSKHPLASAILHEAEKNKYSLLEAIEVTEQPGKGLSGIIGKNKIQITHRNKILETQPELAKELPPSVTGLECMILINDQYVATFRFRDVPRKETKSFISHLKPFHQFNKIMLVSGDRESEVKYLGTLLNLSTTVKTTTTTRATTIKRAITTMALKSKANKK